EAHRPGDVRDVVHARAHDDGLAVARDVLYEGVVVALAGADLVGGDAHALEPLGRCARERGAEVDEAARLRVRLEAAVLILVERATRHDVPDGFLRVAGDDGLRARRHLLPDDLAPRLHHLRA